MVRKGSSVRVRRRASTPERGRHRVSASARRPIERIDSLWPRQALRIELDCGAVSPAPDAPRVVVAGGGDENLVPSGPARNPGSQHDRPPEEVMLGLKDVAGVKPDPNTWSLGRSARAM